MANISSIGGNPIVPAAVQPNSITNVMLAQTGGVLDAISDLNAALGETVSPALTWSFGELNRNGTVNQRTTGLKSEYTYLHAGDTVTVTKSGYKFNLAQYTGKSVSMFISDSYNSGAYGDTLTITADTWTIISIWHSDNSAFSDLSEGSVVSVKHAANRMSYATSPLFRSSVRFGSVPSDYYAGTLASFTADGLSRGTTTDQMIAKFDTLVDGTYVTKKDLGVCSDGTHHLYEYDLTPAQCGLTVEGITYYPKHMPTLLIISAQHGFEKGSVFGLYYLMQNLVNGWESNSALAYIRNHMSVKVIPICNPYGFDNNSYYNANGVNINRNYDTPGFDGTVTPGTSNYGGTVAGSEPETQIICDFIKTNMDALFLLDFHTNGQYAVESQSNINWLDFAPVIDPLFEDFKYVAQSHVEKMSMRFASAYSLAPNAPIGIVTSGANGYTADFPSADCWALEQGLCGHTIEGFCGFPNGTTFTADVCKANAELIGNWMVELVGYWSKLTV